MYFNQSVCKSIKKLGIYPMAWDEKSLHTIRKAERTPSSFCLFYLFLRLLDYRAAKSAPALNLTAFFAGMLITAFVLGLIPFLAAF